jgi:hypothetical protein
LISVFVVRLVIIVSVVLIRLFIASGPTNNDGLIAIGHITVAVLGWLVAMVVAIVA